VEKKKATTRIMITRLTLVLALTSLIISANAREDLSQVKKQMIEESISHYPGLWTMGKVRMGDNT